MAFIVLSNRCRPCSIFHSSQDSYFGRLCLLQPIHGNFAFLQGVWLRDYEPVTQRQDNQTSVKETLGEIKPSNAYKRRVAGTNWQ